MTSLNVLTTDQVLKRYDLPHRLLVRFSVHCADKALALVKDPDPRSVKAVALAKRFSQGEDIAQEELDVAAKDAWDAASSYYSFAAYHAASAARAATSYASASSYAASASACAASSAAYYAASPKKRKAFEEELRQELLRMIRAEFSEVELLLRSNE